MFIKLGLSEQRDISHLVLYGTYMSNLMEI